MRSRVYAAACIFVLLAPEPSRAVVDMQPLVSLVRLISRPEVYFGKKVKTEGFVVLDYEGAAVYISESDYRNRMTANALFLQMSQEDVHKYSVADRRYCWVSGTMNNSRGHGGLYSGTLRYIGAIVPMPRFE